jgi:hypothetical protein
MRLPPSTIAAILGGDVDLAFRRWERPRVVAGTQLRRAGRAIEVVAVEPVALREVDADQVRRAGYARRADLLAALAGRDGTLYRVTLRAGGADPRVTLREQADLSEEERAAITARLDRFDASAPGGPWTRATLRAIAAEPGRRAPDLAAAQGRETPPFKRDVRKLKELGLTESLEVGYRLSPRGRAYLNGSDQPASPD